MIFLSIVSLACGFANVYITSHHPQVTIAFPRVKIPASIQTITACIADIYITASLCFILYNKKTGFKFSENALTRLIFSLINRGILTAALQLIVFITYIAIDDGNGLVWVIFHFPGAQIYVNSLLAVLNARHYMIARAQATRKDAQDIHLQDLSSLGQVSPQSAISTSNLPTVITVSTEVIHRKT